MKVVYGNILIKTECNVPKTIDRKIYKNQLPNINVGKLEIG